MNILTTFAQSYSNYYNSSSSMDSELSAGAAAAMLFVFFLIIVASYVIGALCLMQIFKKAGIPAWPAWVPIYNNYKLMEIGGQQGFWAILALIPIVSIVSAVFMYIAMYHIGKKLGKGDAFVVLAIFLPVVWLVWLAVDKSTWNDEASTAPSIA